MIYLRTSSESLYETVRLQLDAAWGHPTPDGVTITCIDEASVAPRDRDGRILLAVRDEFLLYEPAATVLPALMADGSVEQISEAEYSSSVLSPL